jgi:hypothetical protein
MRKEIDGVRLQSVYRRDMNRLSQLAASFQGNVEEYIRALDEVHGQLKADALSFLKSIRSEGQKQSNILAPNSAPPRLFGPKDHEFFTDVIESVILDLDKSEFSVVDVKNAFRESQPDSKATDIQIGTAFRKLVKRTRPPSILEKIRVGKGSIPSTYRRRNTVRKS